MDLGTASVVLSVLYGALRVTTASINLYQTISDGQRFKVFCSLDEIGTLQVVFENKTSEPIVVESLELVQDATVFRRVGRIVTGLKSVQHFQTVKNFYRDANLPYRIERRSSPTLHLGFELTGKTPKQLAGWLSKRPLLLRLAIDGQIALVKVDALKPGVLNRAIEDRIKGSDEANS